MFSTLSEEGINIQMITTSEIKISVLVARDKCDAALKAVHRGFNLDADTVAVPAVGPVELLGVEAPELARETAR